jgi:hypothetical protein
MKNLLPKKSNLFLATLITGLTLVSCQSDNEIDLNKSENNSPVSQVYEFEYNGKKYSSEFYYTSDSIFTLKDPEADKVFEKIMASPDYVLYVDDNKFTYYNNAENFELNNKNIYARVNNVELPGRCTQNCRGTVLLAKDTNLRGTQIDFPYSQNGIGIPNLRAYNFNDKLSSFMATNSDPRIPSVIFYRDNDYKGASIVFKNWTTVGIGSPTNITEMNLRRYRINRRYTWNDQASSFKVIY